MSQKMKEKLSIKEFGPIEFVELNLSKVNVFIGDQGTGKSTVAKLLTAIKNHFNMDLFSIESNVKDRETKVFVEHLKLLGIQGYLSMDTQIIFSCKDYEFGYINNEAHVTIHSGKARFTNLNYDFTYIPSDRNLVVTLSDSLYALMETGTSLPRLFLRFGNKFQKARIDKKTFDYESILGVSYKHNETGDFITLPNGKVVPIEQSSSGIQSAITLLAVFDYVVRTKLLDNLIVLEELELNCFPQTQFELVKYIFSKNHKKDLNGYWILKNDLFITTHSPYILTSLNNLMYAYQVGQNHEHEVEKILSKEVWINPADVSVYMMLRNGTCESILDKDGLIKAEKIDSVSVELNKEFNAIMDIELSIER